VQLLAQRGPSSSIRRRSPAARSWTSSASRPGLKAGPGPAASARTALKPGDFKAPGPASARLNHTPQRPQHAGNGRSSHRILGESRGRDRSRSSIEALESPDARPCCEAVRSQPLLLPVVPLPVLSPASAEESPLPSTSPLAAWGSALNGISRAGREASLPSRNFQPPPSRHRKSSWVPAPTKRSRRAQQGDQKMPLGRQDPTGWRIAGIGISGLHRSAPARAGGLQLTPIGVLR